MKYTVEIVIDLNIDHVTQLFDSSEDLKKWQSELVSFEHLTGRPGQPGAKSKLVYQMGKQQIEMIETITLRNLPFEFHSSYEANGVFNTIKNRFEYLEFSKTKWTSENEFQFSGMLKLTSFFTKSSFPKQTLKFMQQFKEYAENIQHQ